MSEDEMWPTDVRLTTRERQVLKHVLLGETNKEISASIGCSVRTVDFHVSRLLRKMGVTSKLALVGAFVSGRFPSGPARALTSR